MVWCHPCCTWSVPWSLLLVPAVESSLGLDPWPLVLLVLYQSQDHKWVHPCTWLPPLPYCMVCPHGSLQLDSDAMDVLSISLQESTLSVICLEVTRSFFTAALVHPESHNIVTFCELTMLKSCGRVVSVTRTRWLHFGSGPDPDTAHRWDTKRNRLYLAEVCAPPSAVPVNYEWKSSRINVLAVDDVLHRSIRVLNGSFCAPLIGPPFFSHSIVTDGGHCSITELPDTYESSIWQVTNKQIDKSENITFVHLRWRMYWENGMVDGNLLKVRPTYLFIRPFLPRIYTQGLNVHTNTREI